MSSFGRHKVLQARQRRRRASATAKHARAVLAWAWLDDAIDTIDRFFIGVDLVREPGTTKRGPSVEFKW